MQDKKPQPPSFPPVSAVGPSNTAPPPSLPPQLNAASSIDPTDPQHQFWLKFMLQGGANGRLQLPDSTQEQDVESGSTAPAPPHLSPFPTFPAYGRVLTNQFNPVAPQTAAPPSTQAQATALPSPSPGKAKRAKKAHPPPDPNRYSFRSTPTRKKTESTPHPSAVDQAPSTSAAPAQPLKANVHEEILQLQRDFSPSELNKLTCDEISPTSSVLATPENPVHLAGLSSSSEAPPASLPAVTPVHTSSQPAAIIQHGPSPNETPTPNSTSAAKAVNDIFSSSSKPRQTSFSNQLQKFSARLPVLPPPLSSPPLNLPPSPAMSSGDTAEEDMLDGVHVGKPSKEETKIINDVVEEVHKFVTTTAEQLNRPPSIIYNALASRSSIAARGRRHPWNVFQPFFYRNKDVVKQMCPGVTGEQPRDFWLDFQKNVPNWQEMLATESALIDLSETKTYRQKKKEFAKRAQDLEARMLLMNQSLGVEGVFVAIGSSVNQDGGLSHVYSTPNAAGFFEDRLRCKESAVVGQLRSHVFDALSRSYAADLPDLPPILSQAELKGPAPAAPPSAPPSQGPSVARSPAQTSARPPVSTASEVIDDADEDDKQGGSDALQTARKELATVLLPMLRKCGVKAGNSTIPWVKLPERLAAAGIAMHNIPFQCPFPGEDKNYCRLSSGSGIRAIGLDSIQMLLAALQSDDPPRFVKVNKAELKGSKEPLFVEAPPPASSTQAFARRGFLNHKVDHHGPPRRTADPLPSSPEATPSPPVKRESEDLPVNVRRAKRQRDVVLSDDEPLAPAPSRPTIAKTGHKAPVEIIRAGKRAPPVRFVDDDEEDEDFVFSEPDPDTPVRRRRRTATPTPSPEPVRPKKPFRAHSEAPSMTSPSKLSVRQRSEAPSSTVMECQRQPAKRPSPSEPLKDVASKKARGNVSFPSVHSKSKQVPAPSPNGPFSTGPPLNPRVTSIDPSLFAPPLDTARLQQYIADGNLDRMKADIQASRATNPTGSMQPPPLPRDTQASSSTQASSTRVLPLPSSAPQVPQAAPPAPPVASGSAPGTVANLWNANDQQQLIQSYSSYLRFCATMNMAPMEMAAFAAMGLQPPSSS